MKHPSKPRPWGTRAAIAAAGAAALVAPLAAVSVPAAASPGPASQAAERADKGVARDYPRTIVTTDPELDDLNSMLRMLLYSNEIQLEGLVYSASQHHYSGDPALGLAAKRWPDPNGIFHIDEAVNRYEQAYPNLRVHDKGFPTPEHLRSLIRWGNVKTVGDMLGDTPGSDLIKSTLLDDKPGPVYLQAWGGPNTIAQALKSIQDEYQGAPEWAAMHAGCAKAMVTGWASRTDVPEYIRPNWPDISSGTSRPRTWGYVARRTVAGAPRVFVGGLDPRERVRGRPDGRLLPRVGRRQADGRGRRRGLLRPERAHQDELRAMGYGCGSPAAAGSWISEGDSSNFALLLGNGLRNWEDASFGGWGGRQERATPNPFLASQGVQDVGPNGRHATTTPPHAGSRTSSSTSLHACSGPSPWVHGRQPRTQGERAHRDPQDGGSWRASAPCRQRSGP